MKKCVIARHSHVVEPKFPGVTEQYVNLGRFYDMDGLKLHKREIMEIGSAYKALYGRAYSCIDSAHSVIRDICGHLIDERITEMVQKRARGIISREIGKSGGKRGCIRRRFLTAFTCKGHVSHFETVKTLADRFYVMDNNLGLAHTLITDIAEAAMAAGHDIILCPSPMDPGQMEHLLIPGLSLAFISTNHYTHFDGGRYRHLRLDAMVESDRMKSHKARIRFSKKVFNLLMQEAGATLMSAKKLHDELEAIYNPFVDFTGVYGLAASHGKIILEK